MANMCLNYLRITKGNKKAFFSEMFKLSALEEVTNQGQRIFGIGQKYLFDIYIDENEKYVSYTTRWNHNAFDLAQIAKSANVQFYLASEEFSSDIFAEFKFDGEMLSERALDCDLLNEIESTNHGYIFRGETYDSRTELCEMLLNKEKFQSISI